MKLILTFLFFYLSIYVNAQQVFDTTYSQTDFNYGMAVTEISSGSYLLVGTANNNSNSYDIVVSKADDLGNIVWQNYYGDPTYNELGYNVYKISNNDFIITGSVALVQAFVLRIDSNGNQLFYDTLSSAYGNMGRSIIETFDHNYVVVTNNGITKIDTSGAVIWSKNYLNLFQPFDIIQTPDSGFAIIGDNQSVTLGYGDVVLARTNSVGDTLWTKLYGGPHPLDNGVTINTCSDGGFIIGGSYDSGLIGTVYPFAYLVRTNSVGDTLWTKVVSSSLGEDQVISVFQTADGGFVYSFDHYLQDIFGNTFLSMSINKCDSNGIILSNWGSTFSDAYVYQPSRDLQPTSDNGYILYCSRLYPPNFTIASDMRLIKTDSAGQILTDVPLEISKKLQIIIYPNPAQNIILFNFNSNANAEFILYNSFGQEVKNKMIFANTKAQSICISDLPNGFYSYQIKSTKQSLSNGKLVILR